LPAFSRRPLHRQRLARRELKDLHQKLCP
jgi:hypothetical protein